MAKKADEQSRQHPETTIENEYVETPASAWDFLKPENYEKSSLAMDNLEHDCIRVHGVELYDGIDDKEFAVLEVSYIINDTAPENLNTERFSLRTGAGVFVKLARDIRTARAAKVRLPAVPLHIFKKGRAWMLEPIEDTHPQTMDTQGEIPF